MKNLLLILLSISTNVFSQQLKPVDNESKVHFVIKNFGISTGGDFNGLKGDITFLPENIASSKFAVSVAAATVDTDNESRDEDLRGKDYFDVAKFPEITIVSSRIENTNKSDSGYFYFNGNLTMHGVTKNISFPFKAEKQKNGFLFTGEFEINRLDFGVGEKSVVLGSKVVVSLSVFAKKS
jgi:polyisoprenoid-binding protein YceI